MNLKVSDILKDFQKSGLIEKMIGNDSTITGIARVEEYSSSDLIFIGSEKFARNLDQKNPGAAVVTADIYEIVKERGFTCLVSNNVNLAQALCKQRYTDRDFMAEFANNDWDRIHPTALIHKSAKIPESALIAPYVIIGRAVSLGENCVVLSHVTIEHDSSLGNDCLIHPHAFIGYDSKIGNNCIIKQGAILGSEGFGFAQDSEKKHHRIPQSGRVVIGDRCVIGALNTIERAAYSDTIIGEGCIFDTHCHIAHNVVMGKDCIIIAQTGIAGSTTIGDRVIFSGQTGVLDHLTVPSDSVFLHRAAVMRNIKQPGVYGWNPLMPMSDYLKNQTVMTKLVDLKKKVSRLEKKLADAEDA